MIFYNLFDILSLGFEKGYSNLDENEQGQG